jgi:hypothetical protein
MTLSVDERKSRLVFVDPEDEALSYWWPAIVFKQRMV